MNPTGVRRVFLPRAAKRAVRAYFAALLALWRLYDLHPGELAGTLRDLERTYQVRAIQARLAAIAALGGRRRGRTAPDSLDVRAGWIIYGVIDHARRHCFFRRYADESRKWRPPLRAEEIRDPGLREAFVRIEALRAEVEKLGMSMGRVEKVVRCASEKLAEEIDRRTLEGTLGGATAIEVPEELAADPLLVVPKTLPTLSGPSVRDVTP